MLQAILNQWFGLWWSVLLWGAALTPGELLFGTEKHSVSSRLRWVFFWAFTCLAQAFGVWALSQFLPRSGLAPLFVLDLRDVGKNWSPLYRTCFMSFITLAWSFAFDFSYYWFHRLQHSMPFLWRFHATHHAIEELNGMNCGHHWMDGILRVPFLLLPISLLIDLRFQEVAVIVNIVGAWTQFVHADSMIDFGMLRWLIVSPRFHRMHHSNNSEHFNRNFAGVYSIIDLMFKTGIFPAKDEKIAVGLGDKLEPRSLRDFLFLPSEKSEIAK